MKIKSKIKKKMKEKVWDIYDIAKKKMLEKYVLINLVIKVLFFFFFYPRWLF